MSSLQVLLQHPWVLALGWTLIHFLWQGSLIALLFGFANVCVTKTSNRYITACTAMLLMVVVSFATFFWLVRSPEVSIAPPALPAFAVASTVAAQLATGQSNIQADPSLTRLLPSLVCAWFAGVLMLSVRSLRAWVSAQRLRTNSTQAADPLWLEMLDRLSRRLEVRRPVKLLQSAVARVPGVVGWFRPVILVPASAVAGLSPEMLEAVIAHELAHVRRCDYLVNVFQTAVETLLFYHPAVWWIGKKIREERENCCDDLAVDACGNALTYARALTELEQLRGSQLVMAATSGSLVGRIRRLLGVRQPAGRTHVVPIAGIVAVSAIFGIWGLAEVSASNRSYESAYLIQAAQPAPSEARQAPPATSQSPSAQPNGFIGGLAASGGVGTPGPG